MLWIHFVPGQILYIWFVLTLPQEYQLMIGLSNWMLWGAYFFTFLTLYLVIIFLTCLLFFVKASVCLLQLNFKRETETRCGRAAGIRVGREWACACFIPGRVASKPPCAELLYSDCLLSISLSMAISFTRTVKILTDTSSLHVCFAVTTERVTNLASWLFC